MSRLVADLLLSRLDAGQLVFDRQPVPTHEMLADVSRQVGRLAAQRELIVDLGCAEGTVRADPARLHQVLLIMLDNSLRHTPAEGRITLLSKSRGRRLS
jgi:signal transduction histidine kinase